MADDGFTLDWDALDRGNDGATLRLLTEPVGCPASVTAAPAQAWPIQQPVGSMVAVLPDWVTVTSRC